MSITKNFPVIEINHVEKRDGERYVLKIDGVELRGIQSYEIHKEKREPWPIITIVIQPRELIQKVFQGND